MPTANARRLNAVTVQPRRRDRRIPCCSRRCCECVARAVRRYLADLDAQKPEGLYELVLREVEKPLLREVLRWSERQPEPRRASAGHQPRDAAQETGAARPAPDVRQRTIARYLFRAESMFDSSLAPIRRALLSVSDKTGLIDLARGLDALGVELISTGGTARSAARSRTGGARSQPTSPAFPKSWMAASRPCIRKSTAACSAGAASDDAVMAEHGIEGIDLLVVNLYPFEKPPPRRIARMDDAIENIDIGGPAMLRAAAKNHEHVAAVVDPADYAELIETLRARRRHHAGPAPASWPRRSTRTPHATTAPSPTGSARAPNAEQRRTVSAEPAPGVHAPCARCATAKIRTRMPRYTSERNAAPGGVATARDARRQGVVLQQSRRCRRRAGMRQGVPQGAGLRHRQARQSLRRGARRRPRCDAYERAYATDPVSAFGGIIAFNQPLDAATAQRASSKGSSSKW